MTPMLSIHAGHNPPIVPRRATPPACAKRETCDWFEKSGDIACHACPLVMTFLRTLPAK